LPRDRGIGSLDRLRRPAATRPPAFLHALGDGCKDVRQIASDSSLVHDARQATSAGSTASSGVSGRLTAEFRHRPGRSRRTPARARIRHPRRCRSRPQETSARCGGSRLPSRAASRS
jgi:hypothetical protein